MMDMYFGLLREAGITGEVLMLASKAYVMRPSGDKAKFFPDPGQLAELCAPEADRRKRAAAAARRGLEILDGAVPPGTMDADRGKVRNLNDALKGCHPFRLEPGRHEIQAVATAPDHRLSEKDILGSRDPDAVARLRTINRTKEQA
jgi:hypothetical protein